MGVCAWGVLAVPPIGVYRIVNRTVSNMQDKALGKWEKR